MQRGCDAGSREWAPIQKWCHKHMEAALKAWFGNVEVVREGNTPLDPEDKYIFGYTPHGLFPIGHTLSSYHHTGIAICACCSTTTSDAVATHKERLAELLCLMVVRCYAQPFQHVVDCHYTENHNLEPDCRAQICM